MVLSLYSFSVTSLLKFKLFILIWRLLWPKPVFLFYVIVVWIMERTRERVAERFKFV
jgi:phage shock protein PspC (stress-responsive transcriptional regulator)